VTLRTITAIEAKRLMDEGAVLVDIREAHEHANEHIMGARHVALSKLDETNFEAHRGRIVLFHCLSGARTNSNRHRLATKVAGVCEALIVDGGLNAWRRAGLPTKTG
jgi:rhodanese-related sulfurtransferase